jgi:hypothetical protein
LARPTSGRQRKVAGSHLTRLTLMPDEALSLRPDGPPTIQPWKKFTFQP